MRPVVRTVRLSRTAGALLALPVAIALGVSAVAVFALGVSAVFVASRFRAHDRDGATRGPTITLDRSAYRPVDVSRSGRPADPSQRVLSHRP